MDKYVGKRVAGGHNFSGRGSGVAFRDHNQEDRSAQNCSRLGCSGRVSSTRGSQIGAPEKAKHMRASFRPMNGKAITGSSSKPFSISSRRRKSFQEQQDQTFVQESAVAESSCRQQIDDIDSNNEQVPVENLDSEGRQGRKEVLESIPKTNRSLKSSLFKGIPTDMTKSSNSCGSSASSSKVHNKQINKRSVSGNQEASSSSFIPHSTTAFRTSTRASKSFSQSLGSGEPRCGIQNLSCTSISDVFPSDYSSDLIGDRRIDMVRKRPSDGESSAATSRGSNASSSGGYSASTHIETSVPSLPIPARIMHQPVSRRTRNRLTIRDGAVSVRTQRSYPGDSRMKPSAARDSSTFPLDESTINPQLQQTQFSIPEALHESSSRTLSVDLPHVFNNSSEQPSSSNCDARSRSTSRSEDRSTRVARGSLGDRHGYRRVNLEGVAEVLLALERIDQDELTYEQLLVLETNLLWGALRFNDRHRDMRMDIDNMSYEELLALEERMGTVSTALTEEQLSKCLQRSKYTCASLVPGITAHDNDDVKCSICQEEYIGGDEVGILLCEHRYHVACIHQWLRQKNWCPVCKSSALPSLENTQN